MTAANPTRFHRTPDAPKEIAILSNDEVFTPPE